MRDSFEYRTVSVRMFHENPFRHPIRWWKLRRWRRMKRQHEREFAALDPAVQRAVREVERDVDRAMFFGDTDA